MRRSQVFSSYQHTSRFSRVAARLIDLLVVAALFFVGGLVSFWLGFVGSLLYLLLQDALGTGQSVGKRIIGLSVIDDLSGISCALGSSALRNIPFFFCFLSMAFPGLWCLLLLGIPLLGIETYLLFTLDSGVRLGDVLSDTLVIETLEEPVARSNYAP